VCACILQNGCTLLIEAARNGWLSVGKALISGGANINASVAASKDTALIMAAEQGHEDFVKLLLTNGADVNYKNKKGCSALWIACYGKLILRIILAVVMRMRLI